MEFFNHRVINRINSHPPTWEKFAQTVKNSAARSKFSLFSPNPHSPVFPAENSRLCGVTPISPTEAEKLGSLQEHYVFFIWNHMYRKLKNEPTFSAVTAKSPPPPTPRA